MADMLPEVHAACYRDAGVLQQPNDVPSTEKYVVDKQ